MGTVLDAHVPGVPFGMAAAVFLLSDFGLRDAYVGILHAVVADLAPGVPVHDLLHEVPPQDVLAARLQLAGVLPYLPDAAVVAAVVDPGVGSERDALVIEARDAAGRAARFVAPDNGLLTSLLDDERAPYASPLRAEAVWRLEPGAVRPPGPGTTFDGRDLFAPAAARLARGDAVDGFATEIDPRDLHRRPALKLEPVDGGVRGRVAWIDRFGDLVSDVPAPAGPYRVRIGTRTFDGPARAFADVPVGAGVSYVGSLGPVEVALRDGCAAEAFGVEVGDPVEVLATA